MFLDSNKIHYAKRKTFFFPELNTNLFLKDISLMSNVPVT